MKNTSRHQAHSQIGTSLAYQSDSQLASTLKKTKSTQGWGINQTLHINERPVFVKRIPLTEFEYERMFDTRNHYQLPMYYHYGVGSAGFGAFRELLIHIKSTQWVLSGECEAFPLLHHFRILKSTTPWKQWESEKLRVHLKYWNSSKRIENYLRSRMEAPYEIALFLEHVPHSLHSWFDVNPCKNLDSLFKQTQEALIFMRSKGVLHLDAHLANILTDGKKVFVSDFGLALDKEFELTKKENEFFQRHQYYDEGELLSCLSFLFKTHIEGLKDKKSIFKRLNIDLESPWSVQIKALLKDLEGIDMPKELKVLLQRHKGPIQLMGTFYEDLGLNQKKNTRFDGLQLERLLKKTK